MLLRVIPLESSHDTIGLTYFVPWELESHIEIGQMVSIPVRKDISLGIIADIIREHGTLPEEIKSVISLVSRMPVLAPEQIGVIDDIARSNLIHIHKVASLFLPRPLQKRITKYSLSDTSETTFLSKIPPFSGVFSKPKLHYIRESSYFNEVRKTLEGEDCVTIAPSEMYFSADRYKEWAILQQDATDTARSKFWLSLQSKEFSQAIWTRRLATYNLSAYSRIVYLEDSLLPDLYHSFHSYSSLDILLSLVAHSGQELHIISRTPLIHTSALAMHGTLELVQYPWTPSSLRSSPPDVTI